MVKPRTFLAILLSLSVLLSYLEGKAIQPQQSDDLDAITQTLEQYFYGSSHSDAEKLAQAFHPDALRYLEKADIPVWQIISKSAVGTDSNANAERILFILSTAHFHGNSDLPTGVSFSEIVNAYDEFVKAGYSVDYVSHRWWSFAIGLYQHIVTDAQKVSVRRRFYVCDWQYVNACRREASGLSSGLLCRRDQRHVWRGEGYDCDT